MDYIIFYYTCQDGPPGAGSQASAGASAQKGKHIMDYQVFVQNKDGAALAPDKTGIA